MNWLETGLEFDGDSLIFGEFWKSSMDCLEANCYYEDLYFYEILTNQSLKAKTLNYYYSESNGYKHLMLKDSKNKRAYFSTQPPPESDPLLFQTWYLYRVDLDIGDPIFYNGPNPPQITINQDFSYTGIEDCALINGDFILGNGDGEYDFILQPINYIQNTNNCPPGPMRYVLWDLQENEILNCDLHTDSQGIDYLTYSASAHFNYSFRNELILTTPENNLSSLKVFPNPTEEKLHFQPTINNLELVSITDINGRIVISIKNHISSEIDVSALKTGMYFLKIQSSEGNTTKKFIKN